MAYADIAHVGGPHPDAVYIGLDLAWSARNRSGAAALLGGPGGAALIEPPTLLGGDQELLGYVLRHAGDAADVVVAVDAPLWVPNQAGRRPAEAALSAAFRPYEAGAHPANRGLLARSGAVRGEALVAALVPHGFRVAAGVAAGQPGRLIVEVFPHPAMVAIFGLDKTLKYKAKPGRSPALRLAEWRRYQARLGELGRADPRLSGHAALLAADVAGLRGAGLKAYEDMVDALFCAYIALYGHRWGAARCRSFGDLAGGAIFTPVPPAMW